MDTNHLENKKVFWSNKWDKLWLLVIPVCLLVDIFTRKIYSLFWFWTILLLTSAFILYILYHMFYPKFAWVDTSTSQGKEVQQKAFDLRYNDSGVFEYDDKGFSFNDKDQNIIVPWVNIESIFAYKRDLMTVDELTMDIFIKNNFRLHLTEETAGWFQFILKIKEVFPAVDKEFDTKLIFPAFATNLTLVYNSTSKTQSELIDLYYEKYAR